ncbi:anthranilate synthase component I family protein [Streptomyces sp. SID8379]|uniref:anthranilate synthase component I family protein n=1 Tax=unclassified Streptomyces TaxID=2593676 RepID=UPI000378B742|nr:anthranilate synthase component I family protein [Streptomyces sp. HmicA12]MYW67569.1 anthranilate synthase component I family protein [Streptomyces sp. SID8379]
MTTLLDSPPRASAEERRTVPVRVDVRRLPPHDPLELYTVLHERHGDEVFLLESLEAPEQDGNTAVVGHGRLAELKVYADRVTVDGVAPVTAALLAAAERVGLAPLPGGARALTGTGQVWDLLRAAQSVFAVDTDIPLDDYAFGFLTTIGYGAAWHMERLPERTADGGPDLVLTLFRDIVRYDRDAGTADRLVAESPDFPAAGEDVIASALTALRPAGAVPEAPTPRSVRDTSDRETFLAQVERCLRHIGVGDIYQIQIGHRIDVSSDLTPLQVYRRLRHRNPSPYMYLVPRDGSTLIGASPEVLFRTRGDRIVMRPIAGTTPRSGDQAVDGPRIEALRASEKECAEHVMLVDLCRNDIGRVCLPGTLDVPGLMTVETYSHVFHLVSTVEGVLDPREDTWSALTATFPAGTVTGAPKIRAMEIVEELESAPRRMYAGAVGLVDVRGWSRLALCIRTITYDGGGYSTQSCAGIVADSEPLAEWQETLHKMGAAYWALTGEELLP